MLYQLNRNLSLEEKGMLAILLHLQEGGVKIDDESLRHFIPSDYYITFHISQLISAGYMQKEKDIYVVHEDNNEE